MFLVIRTHAVGGQDDLPVALIGVDRRHADAGMRVDPGEDEPVGPEIGEDLVEVVP